MSRWRNLDPWQNLALRYPAFSFLPIFQVHAFGAELCFGKMTKQKEPITQNIRNRREHSSRFKVMFYVIGSEESKSGSASYSSRQQNQRRGGAVRNFRCTDTVSDEPTNYVSIWSNISIQLLCSGVPLCHYYTDNVLYRQDCESLSLYSELQRTKKRTKINGCRKVLSTCQDVFKRNINGQK